MVCKKKNPEINIKRPVRGFTLVELAIVLLIIGLLVGGVLTGRDLIEVARLRATVAQLDMLEVGSNTFFSKYKSYPGDILQSKAIAFGLTQASTCNPVVGFCQGANSQGCYGNGDGLLDLSGGVGGNGHVSSFELANVFYHLSRANLVVGQYSAAANLSQIVSCAPPSGVVSMNQVMPEAEIGGYIFPSDWDGANGFSPRNSFVVGMTVPGFSINPTFAQLTGFQAFWIDSKVDDGRPNAVAAGGGAYNTKGKVTLWSTAFNSSPNCIVAATGEYDVNNANRICSIQYRWK